MLSTFTAFSLPSYYCESGSAVEADASLKSIGLGLKGHDKGAQMASISPLSGVYRPSTASGFMQGTTEASAGVRLKEALRKKAPNAMHQGPGALFGSKPLRPEALRLLTDVASIAGPPPRETLSSRSGLRNETFLNLKKSVQTRHANMRRTLITPEYGPGTGYRCLENTMPLRNLLRDKDAQIRFRNERTIDGVQKLIIPAQGPPLTPKCFGPADPSADCLAFNMEGGRGKYRFSEGCWRPGTAPEQRHKERRTGVEGTLKLSDERADFDSGRPTGAAQIEKALPRCLTCEGSSSHATALRQLEREQHTGSTHMGARDGASFEHYQPTRGNMLMVFSHMDEDRNGIITEVEFINAIISLGVSVEEAKSYFNRLDKEKRGLIKLQDWGVRDSTLVPIIANLTTRYMRKYMALPSVVSSPQAVETYSRRLQDKEVSSLRQARILASNYTFQHGTQAKMTGDHPVTAALRFVDTDGKGSLGRSEILDALRAIGISLKASLADTIIDSCARDAQGNAYYSDLVRILT